MFCTIKSVTIPLLNDFENSKAYLETYLMWGGEEAPATEANVESPGNDTPVATCP